MKRTTAKIYDIAHLQMMFRVIDGPEGPGLIELKALRQLSEDEHKILQNQIDTIKGKNTSLEVRVAQLQSKIVGIENRLTNTETRITSLEAVKGLTYTILSGNTDAQGLSTVNFGKTYSEIPLVLPILGWALNHQMVIPNVTSVSTTAAAFDVKRSRGTLLLTTGPFEQAPLNTPFRFAVIGK